MVSVRRFVVEEVARWWSEAPQEARFRLLQRVCEEAPKVPTLEELKLAIIAAETEAGEIIRETGPAS